MKWPLKVILGHSFCNQSVTGQQRVVYRHIIFLALSLKFPKLPIQIAKKLQSSTTPLSFEIPAKRNNRECAHAPYYFQKLKSLAYIFVADSMGLSSYKFVQWASKDASFLHQSAFWPFKVVQGHPRSFRVIQGR